MFWWQKAMRDFWLLFSENPLLLDSTFVGIRLGQQNVKPTWLKHLCIEHWWFVQKVNISSILQNNGFPESIMQIIMSKKIALFNWKPKEGTAKVSSLLEAPLDWQNFFEFWKANQDCYQPMLPSCWTSHYFYNENKFCLQSIKMFYPPFNKVWSYINACAAVTVGTWIELPKDCKTELINTFRDA